MTESDGPIPEAGPGRWMSAERGWTLYELHRFDEAAAIAEEGLADTPDDPALLVLFGSAVLAAGETARARKVAASAIAAAPENADAHVLMARVLRVLDRNGEASDAAQRAVALAPWSPVTHAAASQAYTDMMYAHRSNVERLRPVAIHHAETCIRLDPFGAMGPICMANVALVSQEWDTADQWGRRALELEPTNSVAHQVLGLAAKGRGDTHIASEHFVEAGALDPRSDSNIEMLRGLVASGPTTLVLAIIWCIAVSMVMNVRDDIGPWWTAAALAPLFGVFGGALFWNRERRRRDLSDRALAALEVDRRIGESKRRSRLRRPKRR